MINNIQGFSIFYICNTVCEKMTLRFTQMKQSRLFDQTFIKLSDKHSWKMILTESSHCRTTWTDTHCPSCCFHTSVNSFTTLINWHKSERQKDCFEYYRNSFCPLSAEIPWLQGREEALRVSPPETVLHQTAHHRIRRGPGVFVALQEHLEIMKGARRLDLHMILWALREEYRVVDIPLIGSSLCCWEELSSKQDEGRFLAWCFPMLFFAKPRFLPGFHKNTQTIIFCLISPPKAG